MIAKKCACVRRVSEDAILMLSKSLLQTFSNVMCKERYHFIGN